MEEAATYLLLEWVEKLFKERIKSIKDLGLYLIDKSFVDGQSSAAHTLLSSLDAQDGEAGGGHWMILSEQRFRRVVDSMESKDDLDTKDAVALQHHFDESESAKSRKKLVRSLETKLLVRIPGS